MTGFIDQNGARAQLDIHVGMYAEAADRGMTLPQYINLTYPTQSPDKDGTTFQQLMAAEGISVKANREYGIRPSTMDQVLNGTKMEAGVVVKDGIPTSRILFPAVFLLAVEDKLVANLDINATAFDKLVAVDESISQERYEQPVINMSKPEAARAMGIAQLAAPASMLTITTLDKAYRIPTWSIGMEISDQAVKSTTLDIVAMALARQVAVQRNERAQNYLLALLNGDIDNADGSLASLSLFDNSSAFDAAATGGVLTQKAWMKYLMKNGTKRTITHIVTDIDTAMKIEGRTGKPTVMQNDGTTNRFDTQFSVMNPTWAKNPEVFLTDIASWPANTMMGFDRNWAIRRVRNLSAQYQAIEAYVMRRSTAMRFDFGEHVNRLFTDAYGGMVLA